MRAVLRDRLRHILEAIESIEANCSRLDFQQFKDSKFLRFGVERCLEIISEASRHIPEAIKLQYPHIPWKRVADIGNRLRHAYDAVNSSIIWAIVEDDLPILKAVIQSIAETEDDGS